jgi:beta-glucosidase
MIFVKSTTRRGFLIGGTVAAAAVGAGLNGAAAYFDKIITRWWSGTFTKPSSENLEFSADEAKDNSRQLSIQIEGEGAVLLKNNGLLPMEATNVALLGYASCDPVYMGAGSVAQGDDSQLTDFYTAFADGGFTVDSTMKSYYEDYKENKSRDNDAGGMFTMMGSDYNIYDEPVSTYQDKLDQAAKDNKTAVVIFSRTGGEGGDLPIDMAGYTNGDAGEPYLRLQSTEKELLAYAEENFEHVVVLLDSSNAMQLDFLDDEKIDAAIWIGAPGGAGLESIPQIMTGQFNPSGHLVDVFPYDVKSNPTYYTCTAGTYNNYDEFDGGDEFDNKVDGGMIWYPEGIYMGYRYFETADAMGSIDYDKTVQFPFGFGLSYTTFDWAVEGTSLGGTHEDINVKVKVTNTGSVAGKDVVQLYYSAPYTEGGIEKSAKVLGAFAKTSLLDPGASETVELVMNADDLASYDYKNEQAYVADAGDYQLFLQTNSHHVKDGCDPIVYNVSATRVYSDSGVGKRASDAQVATNHFDQASEGDGNVGSTIPWMTRANWEASNPAQSMGGMHITQMDVAMGSKVVEYMNNSCGGSDVNYDEDDSYVCQSLIPVAQGEQNNVTCDDLAGYTEWNDEIWDKLVNEMSIEDQNELISGCAYGTPEIASIGKKLCTDIDGPAGISSQNLNYYGHEFCGEPVTAATWNVDLANQMGACVGNEALAAGVNGWYAPAINIHRTPFGGRCAEYYSEDPLLAGKICAAEIKGVQDKGVYVYLKHFAMNDQDAKRGGMYTWANEQAIREIYLRGFEIGFKEGGAKAAMMGYNRIGTVENAVSRALITDVLHGEWGSHAHCLTDGYGSMFGCDKYEHPDLQIRAGGGQLLNITGYDGTNGLTERTTGSEKGREMMHDMCKRILYVYCNSNAMTTTRDYTPYWKYLLGGIDVLLVGGVALAWWKDSRLRKAEKEEAETGQADKAKSDKA